MDFWSKFFRNRNKKVLVEFKKSSNDEFFEAYKGNKPYVFISYAHADSLLVYPVIKWLDNIGFRIWYDEGIDPGNEWPEEIAKSLDACEYFIVFLSRNSIKSRNVRNEINFALNNEKKFLAVHLEKISLPKGLELRISDIQAILKYKMGEITFQKKIKNTLPKNCKGKENFVPDPNNISSSKIKIVPKLKNVKLEDTVPRTPTSDESKKIIVHSIREEKESIKKIESADKDHIVSEKQNRNIRKTSKSHVLERDKSDSSKIELMDEIDIQAEKVSLNTNGTLLATTVGYGWMQAGIVGYIGLFQLWDLKQNKLIKSITNELGSPRDVKFSPDDRFIAIGGYESIAEVVLWEYQIEKEPTIISKKHKNVVCIEFSPDSKLLFSAGKKSIDIWDVEKRVLIKELIGHSNNISDIAIDKEGKVLVSVASNAEIGIWDLEKYEIIRFIKITYCSKVVFLDNSYTIAIGLFNIFDSKPNKTVIYDIEKDRIIETVDGQVGGDISALEFNILDNVLVHGGRNCYVHIGGSLNFYKKDEKIRLIKSFDYRTTAIDISDIAFSKDGRVMVTAQSLAERKKSKVTQYSVRVWRGF